MPERKTIRKGVAQEKQPSRKAGPAPVLDASATPPFSADIRDKIEADRLLHWHHVTVLGIWSIPIMPFFLFYAYFKFGFCNIFGNCALLGPGFANYETFLAWVASIIATVLITRLMVREP